MDYWFWGGFLVTGVILLAASLYVIDLMKNMDYGAKLPPRRSPIRKE